MEKYVIWSNNDLDFEDWRDSLQEEYPDMSEDEMYDEMLRQNAELLDDERLNLNIVLPNDIVVIADIGRWNGRFISVGTLTSRNLGDCLQTECDYATWYVDADGEFRCDAHHHDGVNHYLYRTLKEGVDADDIEFFDDPEKGKRVILEKTESLGPVICGVYGWDVVA